MRWAPRQGFSAAELGDTIVEVLISMTVLSVVLGAAYAISTRSLQLGTDSQARGQALSYAQAQLELIKNADNNNKISSYKVSHPFHISQVDGSLSSGPASQSPFTITDVFETNPASSTYQSFKVTVTWPGVNGQTNQTTLNYKAHNSFVCGSQVMNLTTCNAPPTTPITTPPPQVGLTFVANCGDGSTCNLPYGGSATLVWSTTNAVSCVASGGWSGSKSTNGGTYSTGALSTTQNYTLTCNGPAGLTQSSKTITLNVAPPAQPNLSFTADAYTVSVGGSTVLHWTASNSTACVASGAWSGSRPLTGSQNTGALTAGNRTFYLDCSGLPGSTPVQKSVTIAATNPPGILAFNTWSESTIYTSKGAPRYLYWNTTNASSCNLSGVGAVSPNSYVYINVYPGTYTLTCYNSAGNSTSATYSFRYVSSQFIAYQHARFDSNWPGWQWGPVGEGYYGLPGDMSSFQVSGRAAVRDNYGHCASFTNNGWTLYGWVQDYGLVNDAFGSVDVGHDCGGN